MVPVAAWKALATNTSATSRVGCSASGAPSCGRNAATIQLERPTAPRAAATARRPPSTSAAQAPSGLASCDSSGTLLTSAMWNGVAPSASR